MQQQDRQASAKPAPCPIARELMRQSRGKLTPAEAVRAAAAERARFAGRGGR